MFKRSALRLMAFMLLSFALMLSFISMAFADTAPNPTTYAPNLATIVGLIVSLVLPAVVALITSKSFAYKGVVLLLATSVTAVVTEWSSYLSSPNDGHPFMWESIVFTALVNFLIALGGYYGVLKDTPLHRSLQNSLVTDKTAA